MYLNGRGVAVDDAIAVRWFRKAAERGIPQAVNLLRMMASIAPSKKTGCVVEVTRRPLPPMPTPPRDISRIVARAASGAGVDPDLVMAVIWAESQFNPRAESVKNARGLMQLMPETAARFHVANPFDPAQNIRGGTSYLRWLLDRFDGDLRLALGAYNAGENAVAAFNGVPNFPETISYVANVIRLYSASLPSEAARAAVGKAPAPK
jgi:soluble lytic murein transglycosylase-like protein